MDRGVLLSGISGLSLCTTDSPSLIPHTHFNTHRHLGIIWSTPASLDYQVCHTSDHESGHDRRVCGSSRTSTHPAPHVAAVARALCFAVELMHRMRNRNLPYSEMLMKHCNNAAILTSHCVSDRLAIMLPCLHQACWIITRQSHPAQSHGQTAVIHHLNHIIN